METVKFNSGEVRQVTSRHAEKLVAAKEAEIISNGAKEVKEVKEPIQTKEEKKAPVTKKKK